MYDYLIVGAGLFGACAANILKEKGYKVLVIEKRDHIAGNIYSENKEGIEIHKYGAHIFHTSNDKVWNYVNKFTSFNNYINSPIANYHGKIYNLPFNMNTFYALFNESSPSKVKEIINKEIEASNIQKVTNLEEQAISLVGSTIYHTLIKEYTEKQWGRDCKELPSEIIKRLPIRYTYDNNYFNDSYQGIPTIGYTKMVEKMLEGVEVKLNTDFLEHKDYYSSLAKNIIFCGRIDEYFNYQLGELEYRSLRFELERLEVENYQGNAVVNYTSFDYPFTRIIEHKHFMKNVETNITYISKEYPIKHSNNTDLEPYYPINDARNNNLYQEYLNLAKSLKNVYFGGRLGLYKYLDMDKIILEAMELIKKICE